MPNFLAGLVTGCLIGIAGTLLLILLAAGISKERPVNGRWFSVRGMLFVLLGTPGVAIASHSLGLRRSVAVLLLMVAVLIIAKLHGLVYGLAASAAAAVALCFLYLPSIGSLLVLRTNDQLLVALFLLSGILGSRIIGPLPKRTIQ
jgi:K+-sensing histidine kinase KdpD